MLRKIIRVLMASGVLSAVLFVTSAAHAQVKVQQAIAQAQSTGRPILAMATREACGNCQRMKQVIEADAELQTVMAEFVVLSLDIDNERSEWSAWVRQFPQQDTTLPFVYIVSATGQEMAQMNGGNVGAQLKAALMQNLQVASAEAQESSAAAEAEQRAAEAAAAREAAQAAREARRAAALAEREEGGSARPTQDPQEETPAARERRLDGYLRMANTFAESRPEKSREYAEKILELDPESPQAAEARALLEASN